MFASTDHEYSCRPRRASAPVLWNQMTPLHDIPTLTSSHSSHISTDASSCMGQQMHHDYLSILFTRKLSGASRSTPTLNLPRTHAESNFPGFQESKVGLQLDTTVPEEHPQESLPASSTAPPISSHLAFQSAHPSTRRLHPRSQQRPLHVHNQPLPHAGDSQVHIRFRTNHACQACRKRKVKCNGTVPCDRCDSRHIECIYSAERKVRGRNKPKQRSPPLALADSLATSSHDCRPSIQSLSQDPSKISPSASNASILMIESLSSSSSTSPFFVDSSSFSNESNFPSDSCMSSDLNPAISESFDDISWIADETGGCNAMRIPVSQEFPSYAQPISRDDLDGDYSHIEGLALKHDFAFDFFDMQPANEATDPLSMSSTSSSYEPSHSPSPASESASVLSIDPPSHFNGLSLAQGESDSVLHKYTRLRRMSDSGLFFKSAFLNSGSQGNEPSSVPQSSREPVFNLP